jgi:lipopolysaccharide export system protein LptC
LDDSGRSCSARNTGLSTTSTLDGTTSHRFAASGRDSASAFRRAARHSRRVRVLRLAIPAVIAVILGGTILVSWLDPLKVLVRLPIEHGKLVISGTKITMQAPKLTGYTRDHRWYELSAGGASQDITKPDMIELQEVRAKIEAGDKSTIHLSATGGLFNRKGDVLTLSRNVVLRSSGGFEMHLDEAVVDTGKGEVVSDKPVSVFTEDATLKAERLEVAKSGEIVRFLGGVVMNLHGQMAAKPAAEK